MQEYEQSCRDCNSSKLVWDWANGDIVCTSCGLVNEERFIDDRCNYKYHEDHEPREPKTIVSKKIDNIVDAINTTLYNGMVDDTTVISERVQNVYEKHSNEDNIEKITKADVVAGVYTCEKGLTARELCTTMNVKAKSFWKSVKSDQIVWEQRLLDIVKRNVYNCANIEKDKEWNVIKYSSKIIDKIMNSAEVQNIRLDRLAISLMYIACKCDNLKFDKKEFVKLYGISLETLYRHEHIIQTILERKNKN